MCFFYSKQLQPEWTVLAFWDNRNKSVFSSVGQLPCKDTVVYWSPQSCADVPFICRSMRLQTRSSAASVRYLGHTPITVRQGDEFCRGNIFMEYSHFFEYYFVVILSLSSDKGSKQQAAAEERWQLGWLGLRVDLSSLYANSLAARQSCVGDALQPAFLSDDITIHTGILTSPREYVWESQH